MSFLESGNEEIVMNKIRKSLASGHTAFVYEDICRERMWDLNAHDAWPFHFAKIGRWWDKENEIDIAAIDPDGKNIILGECKYWQDPVGIPVLRELEQKSISVGWQRNGRQIWYILFSVSGFTDELKGLAAHRNDLLLCDDSGN